MDNERSNPITNEHLSEWSDEQLRQLLLTQMDAVNVDVDLVRCITTILAKREEENGHEIDPHIALKSFKQEYETTPALYRLDEIENEVAHPQDSHSQSNIRARKLVRLVAVAAVVAALLLGISIVANASGLDLWGVVTRWTDDVFGITREEPGIRTIHKEQTDDFYHLKKNLEEMGISHVVVPNYIPNGYVFASTNYSDTYDGFYAECILNNGENDIILRYWISSSNQTYHFYSINESEPEIYVRNGIEHYIMTNEDEFIVSWTNENLLCDISGLQSYDELIRMINSIYEKDD